MTHPVLLIAAREFRQIVAARSFWVTLLVLPLVLAIGPIASRVSDRDPTERIMLIDPSGTAAPLVAQRLERERQRGRDSLPDPARERPNGAVTFPYRLIPPPRALMAAPVTAVAQHVPELIDPPGASRSEPVDYVVYVPAGFAGGAAARIWADHDPSPVLMTLLRDSLAPALRRNLLKQAGVHSMLADRALSAEPTLITILPPPDRGHDAAQLRTVGTLVLSYLLLMTLMLSGSWALQSMIEERSNKLLEALLACVSPAQLLRGKLLGTVAVGLTMATCWIGCAAAAALATHGMFADQLRPAIAPFVGPGLLAAMLFYFVAGYLMIAALFVAIGSISDSVRDAQSYLGPVMLVVALPYGIAAQALIYDPYSLAVRVMSWVPLWTPFTMMARLGTGVPWWEIVGSAALLALFVTGELILLGRLFRVSLLNAGGRPKLAQVLGMMRRDHI